MATGKDDRKRSLTPNKLNSKKIFDILKGVAVYILVGFIALIFFVNLSAGAGMGDNVPLSQIVNDAEAGKINKITVEGDKIIADIRQPGRFLHK